MRVHGSAATNRSAVAIRVGLVAVVQVVVVRKFFVCGNIANCPDPDPAPDLVSFAVGIAGVIDEHCGAVAIDHNFAVTQSKKIGGRRVLILLISGFLADARASVLHHPGSRFDGRGGVTAGSVNGGGANDEAHRIQ